MLRGLGVLSVAVAATILVATFAYIDARAKGSDQYVVLTTPSPAASAVADTPATPASTPAPVPTPAPLPAHPAWLPLDQAVGTLAINSQTDLGVAVIELGGSSAQLWSYNGDQAFTAASTYKLVALMDEASLIASGKRKPADQLCFDDSEYEDGWYNDYTSGECFSLQEIAGRAGQFSDNTAGHMLVADVGGEAALNAFASAHGARSSSFFDVNTTTASDLAALWAAEARGEMGGAAAQSWLYPLLTHTHFEDGVPAGVPSSIAVVHKTGQLDSIYNDAALVRGGKSGDYVVVLLSDDGSGSAGWGLLAQVSAAVWQYEQTR